MQTHVLFVLELLHINTFSSKSASSSDVKKLSDLCDLSDFTLTLRTPGGSLWQRHEVVYHHERSRHLGRIEPLAEPGQCHRSLTERPSVGRHSLPKMTVTGVRCKHQT